MKRSLWLTACLFAITGLAFGQDDRFTIVVTSADVEDGATISGGPGSEVTIAVHADLVTTEAGVTGIVLPLGASGANPVVSYPHAPCDATCANGLYFGGGGNIFFYDVGVVDPDFDPGDGPQGPGIIAGVTTNVITGYNYPAGTHPFLDFELTLTVPEAIEGETVELNFKDGLKGIGTPKNLTVTFQSASVVPAFTGLSFTLAPSQRGMIPGDTDEDGTLDTMDVIEYLDFYFLGDPDALPCGDGSITDPGNLALLDNNGDGELDISDAIYSLRSQFLGGPPHVLGEDCTQIAGCPNDSCDA